MISRRTQWLVPFWVVSLALCSWALRYLQHDVKIGSLPFPGPAIEEPYLIDIPNDGSSYSFELSRRK